MKTTTTPGQIPAMRGVLDTLATVDLPRPRIECTWSGATDDDIRAVMAAFPDANWTAHAGGSSEWVTCCVGRAVSLTVFAAHQEPVRSGPRIAALLPEQTGYQPS